MRHRQKFMAAAAAFSIALGTFAALPAGAQDAGSPIDARQKLMKMNGRDSKAAAGMIKGETAFDPAKAEQIFMEMHQVSMEFGTHFPEDSKTGGDTEAAPAIWNEPDKWKAALAKFQADTETAMNANPQTVDAFKQQFGMVAQNCKSCHEEFRVKKN